MDRSSSIFRWSQNDCNKFTNTVTGLDIIYAHLTPIFRDQICLCTIQIAFYISVIMTIRNKETNAKKKHILYSAHTRLFSPRTSLMSSYDAQVICQWRRSAQVSPFSRIQCCPSSVDLQLAVAHLATGCDYYLLVIIMRWWLMIILIAGRPWTWQFTT